MHASAQLVASSQSTQAKWTEICMDLYNTLKKEKKINLAVEKLAKATIEEKITSMLRVEPWP
jgi:autonomous glycyl radical cofactor GrcA